jgi:hypothetical protein
MHPTHHKKGLATGRFPPFSRASRLPSQSCFLLYHSRPKGIAATTKPGITENGLVFTTVFSFFKGRAVLRTGKIDLEVGEKFYCPLLLVK